MSGAAPPDRPGLQQGLLPVELVLAELAEEASFLYGLCGQPDKQGVQGPFSGDAALAVPAEDISLSLAACLCGLRCPLTSEDFEVLSLWSLPSLEICIVGAC